MTCACLYHGPSHLPVYWSCPLAHSLGLPCLRGLPLWVWLGLFGSLPPWFSFCGVGWFFAGLFAPLVWSGRLALQTPWIVPIGLLPSVFMVCFRGGLLRLLLWLPPSLCAVYLGAVQIKVRTDLVLAAGVLSLRHRKSATERIPSLLTGLVRLVLDPVLRASSGSLAQGSAGSAWFVEPPKWSIAPSTFSFYSQVIIYSFETSGDLQHFYSTVYPSSAPRIATMLVEQRSTENMPH